MTKFEELCKGEMIHINENEIFEFKIISNLIENEELSNRIDDMFLQKNNETNIDEYLTLMTKIINLNKYTRKYDTFSVRNIIDFISSHFYSIDTNKLAHFPKAILYSIISNPKLKIESEDSLFEFIKQIFENEADDELNSEFNTMRFYEQVELKNLSEEKLREIIESISPNEISNEIWPKLCECFYFNKNNSKLKNDQDSRYVKVSGQKYLYKGKPFEGIIDHLTKETGSNVSDNGTVKVTSSSINSDRVAKNAVDLHNNQNYFQSNSIQNSCLKYDFGEKKVHPTHYSIRTRHDNNGWNPQNWVIEGTNVESNDENVWKRLDSRQYDSYLNDTNVSHTYDITEHIEQNESFRYLRIRNIGNDSSGSNHLTLSALEFFGTLI